MKKKETTAKRTESTMKVMIVVVVSLKLGVAEDAEVEKGQDSAD